MFKINGGAVVWQICTEMTHFFNNDMDDIFNQVFRRMGNSESARYVINGRELSPE